jgi:general secretion pathway protein G
MKTDPLPLAEVIEQILCSLRRPAHVADPLRALPPSADVHAGEGPRRRWGAPRERWRRAAGFTLIEVLVVIVVITVLATLVAPNVFRHVGSAKEATAKTQLEMLGSAIDAYRLDNDEYPTTEQGLAALRARPQSGPQPRSWRGPYLRRDVPLDPWGRPYVYRSPGVANPEGYDLLTLGRDGREGGEGEDADVLGWK